MESLIKEGRVTRGWIGVEPRDLTPEIAKTLDLPVKQGVLITGVRAERPGERRRPAARRRGRSKIAGTPVTNTPQLLNAVAALKPRETATISVQRGDDALDVKVTVGQRPPAKRRASRSSARKRRPERALDGASLPEARQGVAVVSSAGACVCLMKICAAQMPTSYSRHIGIASASCETTSGGVRTAAMMNARTMK